MCVSLLFLCFAYCFLYINSFLKMFFNFTLYEQYYSINLRCSTPFSHYRVYFFFRQVWIHRFLLFFDVYLELKSTHTNKTYFLVFLQVFTFTFVTLSFCYFSHKPPYLIHFDSNIFYLQFVFIYYHCPSLNHFLHELSWANRKKISNWNEKHWT